MIKELKSHHAQKTARIHLETLPNEFLPSFGYTFLTVLHSHLIATKHVVSVGYFENQTLYGFAIATLDTYATFREIFIHGFWQLLPIVLKKILTSPGTAKYIVQTLTYGKKTHVSMHQSELLVIAVSPTHRHRGIGKELMKSMYKRLEKKGVKSLSVTTVVDNTISNAFYKRLGGQQSGRFRLYDKNWNIYTLHF